MKFLPIALSLGLSSWLDSSESESVDSTACWPNSSFGIASPKLFSASFCSEVVSLEAEVSSCLWLSLVYFGSSEHILFANDSVTSVFTVRAGITRFPANDAKAAGITGLTTFDPNWNSYRPSVSLQESVK